MGSLRDATYIPVGEVPDGKRSDLSDEIEAMERAWDTNTALVFPSVPQNLRVRIGKAAYKVAKAHLPNATNIFEHFVVTQRGERTYAYFIKPE